MAQATKQKFWLILNNKNSLDSLDFCAQRKEYSNSEEKNNFA